MRRAISVLLLGLTLVGCESAPAGGTEAESEPSAETGSFRLSESEKALVAGVNGRPMADLFGAIGTIVAERRGQVKKNKLIKALDQAFEVRCHEICEVEKR